MFRPFYATSGKCRFCARILYIKKFMIAMGADFLDSYGSKFAEDSNLLLTKWSPAMEANSHRPARTQVSRLLRKSPVA